MYTCWLWQGRFVLFSIYIYIIFSLYPFNPPFVHFFKFFYPILFLNYIYHPNNFLDWKIKSGVCNGKIILSLSCLWRETQTYYIITKSGKKIKLELLIQLIKMRQGNKGILRHNNWYKRLFGQLVVMESTAINQQ